MPEKFMSIKKLANRKKGLSSRVVTEKPKYTGRRQCVCDPPKPTQAGGRFTLLGYPMETSLLVRDLPPGSLISS
jgi:hypothetical protein